MLLPSKKRSLPLVQIKDPHVIHQSIDQTAGKVPSNDLVILNHPMPLMHLSGSLSSDLIFYTAHTQDVQAAYHSPVDECFHALPVVLNMLACASAEITVFYA
jgi:hypothetical protein